MEARARMSQKGARSSWLDMIKLIREIFKEKMGTAGLGIPNSMSSMLARASVSLLSPVAKVKTEARAKQAALKRFRLLNANALGVLVGEALNQDWYVFSLRFVIGINYL